MSTVEQFDAVLARIDEATSKHAVDLRALKEELKNQGLPKSVEDAVLAKLEAAATRLEGIGKDPENPVPDEEEDNDDDEDDEENG